MVDNTLTWRIEPQKIENLLSCFCHCIKCRVRVIVGLRVRVRGVFLVLFFKIAVLLVTLFNCLQKHFGNTESLFWLVIVFVHDRIE